MEPDFDIDLLELAKAKARASQGQAAGQPRSSRPMGKAMAGLTALASGIPGMEYMAGAISAMTGGTYQGGRRDIAQAQERAKESIGPIPYGGIRIIPETAGMIAAPQVGIGRALAGRGLTGVLSRAGVGAGVEGLRGMSRAGITEEEAPSVGQTLREGAKGAAYGSAGSVVGDVAPAAILGGLRMGRNAIARMLDMPSGGGPVPGAGIVPSAQQAASNLLRRTGMTGAADVLEPIAAPRVSRTMQELFPERESASGFTVAAQEAREAARQATQAATRTAGRTAREQAAAVRERGAQQLAQVRAREAAAREARDTAIRTARDRAQATVAQSTEQLRAKLPREVPTNADELRNLIRQQQVAAGDVSYNRAFQLAEGVDFSPIAREAENVIRKNPELSGAYTDAFRRGTAMEAGEDVLPVLDLKTFDAMRQNINEKVQMFMRGDPTGIPRNKARQALKDIDGLEQAYVSRIRETQGEEAANALIEARAEYAEYFRQLESLADGRNLGRFGFGKVEGRIEPSRLNIEQLERRIAEVSPESREAFQVGSREWVNDVIRKTPEDARKLAGNLVGTEERYRRTVLALGKDAADDLRVLYRDNQQVRDAAAQGLQSAKDEIAGRFGRARSAAELERNLIQTERRQSMEQVRTNREAFLDRLTGPTGLPERQAAREATQKQRVAGQAFNAVSATEAGADAALGFSRVIPTLSPQSKATAAGVMATRIDNRLMALIQQPNGAEKVAQEIARLRQNPATSALLGSALEEAERRLMYGVPLRRPIGSVLGSTFAAQFNRE